MLSYGAVIPCCTCDAISANDAENNNEIFDMSNNNPLSTAEMENYPFITGHYKISFYQLLTIYLLHFHYNLLE
jgi:hypothetical protein